MNPSLLAWAGLLLPVLILAQLGAAEPPPGPAEAATSENPRFEFTLKTAGQSVVLNWHGREGIPFQVQASTDLDRWTDLSPILIGTNAWMSLTLPKSEIQSALDMKYDGRDPATAGPSVPVAAGSMAFFRIKDLAAAAMAAEEDTGDREGLSRVRPTAVTAFFASSAGILSVTGNNLDNQIVVSRNAAGILLVNGGAVAIRGGTPTVANTTAIQVFGLAGNDTLTLDETTGALPRALLYGGSGNDTLTGGSGADQLFGQAGDDVLLGRGGNDFLFGGTDNDTLTGGDAEDQVFGESGNDRFVWNPGDDTDLNEGGADTDTVEVNGGNGAEIFTTTANGTRVRFDRLQPAPFAIDIGTSETLVLNANGGDDRFSAVGNLAALIKITVDGGSGNDSLLGSNGIDLLLGGDGDDFVDGQQGNDIAFLGAGKDVFQWDPGDGSDVVEGQAGDDRLVFNGSAANEIFAASPNGGRVRFTRNIGNIIMDLNDVEALDVHALNGTDTITLDDLAGTALTQANVFLAGTLGGTAADALADVVIVHGSNGDDIVDVFGSGTSYSVVGLPTLVTVRSSAGADDSLVINALGGNDGITAATVPAGIVQLTVDGGAGNDTLLGSQGADVFLGGAGDDFIDGQQGNDLALMGAGNDVFQWDPGDGSDTLEGQEGIDSLLFLGSNASEHIDAVANGGRILFLRNVGNVTLDLDDIEQVDLRALGGSDAISVGDLSGTDLTRIGIDLRGPSGGGDGQADTVTVNATQGADTFGAAGDAGGVTVFGLHARIDLFHQEHAQDRLTLNGLGGNDVLDATSLEADGIALTLNGGLGNDHLLGSEGADLANGGDGDDIALLGNGNDTFVWNPGDDNDTLEGQAGVDTLVFHGANVAESIDISPNGGRIRLFRNIANVLMDLNDLETITFNALGGADVIAVQDLKGTDIVSVNLNLAAANGAGDAQPDSVILAGSSGNDTAIVTGDPTQGVQVVGLSAQLHITGSEPANDRLTLNLLAGDDIMDAVKLAVGVIQLTANGGDGADVLLGSAGADVLSGGAGDDVLIGGPGVDVLDGGSGNNVVIQ